ncbi:hypothetical protein [Sediminibacterium salmoneum]|uniref:hypothetical protein n=1 Tax=Sediminibacterium salmoneum TaxID=426421 RepID=UPI00047C681F|nr:hypothetical protein [Sediminibacterium salmoneum]
MIINSLSTVETLPENIQGNKTITLEQIDTTGQVILHCKHFGCNAECGKSIRCEIKLNPGIALVPVDVGNPSTLLHTYKINLPPKKNYKTDYCTEFTLVFSALPKNCTAFHFIEPDAPDGEGWVIRNVKRSATDVYSLTFSNQLSYEGEIDF